MIMLVCWVGLGWVYVVSLPAPSFTPCMQFMVELNPTFTLPYYTYIPSFTLPIYSCVLPPFMLLSCLLLLLFISYFFHYIFLYFSPLPPYSCSFVLIYSSSAFHSLALCPFLLPLLIPCASLKSSSPCPITSSVRRLEFPPLS